MGSNSRDLWTSLDAYNKAFKRDSQRLAVLVLIGFSVYGTMP